MAGMICFGFLYKFTLFRYCLMVIIFSILKWPQKHLIMKRILLILLIAVTVQAIKAQSVGIGTVSPHASAQLDVSSTGKGLLIPRMSKTEKNNIATPATGLLVFQHEPDSIGFYYYSGASWLWLINTLQEDTLAWKTSGNTGTNTANHFLGTTNNVPISFRQNNIWLGRWNSATSNYFIGDSAGAMLSSGIKNMAIGTNALKNNSTGNGNVAIGDKASGTSEASSYNVAIGNSAMLNHKRTGDTYNTAVGASALEQDSIGFQNTAVGTSSFRFNKQSPYNSGLGVNSGYYQKGSDNTFAGAYAGYGERINPANVMLDIGIKNTGLGAGALYRLCSGNYNVALGQDALLHDSSGSYNVSVGHNSLPAITSGSYNVGIGYNTNGNAGTLTNTTTIGSHAFVTQSNSLILGSISGVNGATTNTNVGIGTTAPAARLHVTDSSVLFSALGIVPGTPGNPPVEGGGRRMMWYADKAAFRAGYINGNQWDNDNIGNWSVATGRNTVASGLSSTAMGNRTLASGSSSTAMGSLTTASGDYSTAMGDSTIASGTVSFASGFRSTASGYYSTAMGENTTASGNYSTAMGRSTTASGDYATATGNNAGALGAVSTAMGIGIQARGYAGTVIGMYNDPTLSPVEPFPSSVTPLFVIGNGNDDANRKNAMVVLKTGNVGIGTNTPAARLDVNANFKLGANGTTLNDIIKSTETYDIPSLAPGAVDIQTFSIANVNFGSAVSISPLLALPNGITISYARVSAAGTVEVKVVNAGTVTQNPASMSFIVVVIR